MRGRGTQGDVEVPVPGTAEGASWWLTAGSDPLGVRGPEALDGATAEVVVVGLGASGLEAVVLLAERGVPVIGVDAVGIAAGAAGANGGFLLAGLADFHHDAIARHGRGVAVRWWHQTVAEVARVLGEEPTGRPVGSLRIAADPAEEQDIRSQLDAMRADGLGVEPYDGPEGRGLLVPGDAALDPAARCRRLATRAIEAGALIVTGARVTDIGSGHGSVTLSAAGRRVVAQAVLVCVDGMLEHLRVDGRRPWALTDVRSVRLQMCATAPDRTLRLPRPIYRRYGYDYVQQLPSGEVLMGGGRDAGGPSEWADAPDGAATDDGTTVAGRVPAPSGVVQAHLDGWAADMGVSAPVTHRWAAWAGFTTDRLPVDATVAPGIHVVGGYSGHGNVIGGLLARSAADRLLQRW